MYFEIIWIDIFSLCIIYSIVLCYYVVSKFVSLCNFDFVRIGI